jgi:hypothetical protein
LEEQLGALGVPDDDATWLRLTLVAAELLVLIKKGVKVLQ